MSEERQPRTPDPRVSIEMPVRISTIDADIDPLTGKPCFRSSEEVAGNVSRTGAFVPMAEPISTGRRLLVEVDIPGGETVQLVGRVVWTRRPMAKASTAEPGDPPRTSGIGVQFLTAASKQLGTLQAYVDRQVVVVKPQPTTAPKASRRARKPGLPPLANP